ncbi:MAG: hypothetical protein ABI140_01200 [Jatrophihabitantaceae bacterium]
MTESGSFERAWTRYALARIQALVNKPREDMTDIELSIYTHASGALAGGDPVIALFARGPGHRLCRVCGAEWSMLMAPEHVADCPAAGLEPPTPAPSGQPDSSGERND